MAGKWPDEVLRLPLGRYQVNEALVRYAQEEAIEQVRRAVANKKDVDVTALLLSKLL